MALILLRRVGEEPLGVEEVGDDETPDEDEDAPGAEREDAPVDEEAKVEDEVDEQFGREADEQIDVEVARVGTYKLEIKCVVGPILK